MQFEPLSGKDYELENKFKYYVYTYLMIIV